MSWACQPSLRLIDVQGYIVEAYYGGDAGDRIPFERVEPFLAKGLLKNARAATASATATA